MGGGGGGGGGGDWALDAALPLFRGSLGEDRGEEMPVLFCRDGEKRALC